MSEERQTINLAPLDFSTLRMIRGGLIERMLVSAIQRATTDLFNAPDIPDARTINLQIKCKPVLDKGTGELSSVAVEFIVSGKTPNRVAGSYALMRSATNGAPKLLFNVDDDESPSQLPLFPTSGSTDEDGDE